MLWAIKQQNRRLSMILKMRKIIILITLISLFSCNIKNDYWITEKRVGFIKIGDKESSVDKKLDGLEIKSYKSGFLPDFIKFKTVSQNGKEIMHLKFQGGVLDGMAAGVC